MKIVANSSADLPEQIIKSLDITIVPQYVYFGEDVYRQGVDISPDEFYRKIETSEYHPRTSQPAPNDFLEAFEHLIQQGHEVVCMVVTSKLSGTYNNALAVKNFMEDGDKVHVVDTTTVTLGEGLLVLNAARMARDGKTSSEILNYLKDVIPLCRTLGVIDSLAFIEKGGRISKLQYMFGSLLKYKPIISIRNGLLEVVGKARGSDAAMRLMQTVADDILDAGIKQVMVGYTTRKREMILLRQYLEDQGQEIEIIEGQIGAAIGAHAGPGLYGMAWIGPFKDEWFE